ncbi:extracellular solute-binding protein [Acetivibrio sp. MSJd-27]|uniref:extracellular solute-binding protein n=1 Tax=Acetivibrio sp. MSJd-27 TaxID=2841523 RepID=UPI001C128BDF|nr:extracellular solute-binding protein [Acetivibrio sp. MSJd-27]MBU5451000.1 extracellular solute-binding protein [Acetivibrio sp. MSJd-27]
MKKYGKWVSVILVFAMTVTLFASCGKDSKINGKNGSNWDKLGDTGGVTLPLDDKNTKLTYFTTEDSQYDANKLYIIEKYREITGIDLELVVTPSSTATEKFSVLAASKKLPDIIGAGMNNNALNNIAQQGALASVDDYVDKLPNYKRIFVDDDRYNWVSKSYQAADGKMYIFFGFDMQRDVNHGILYRKDIFDKHGIKMWNGPDEFYAALKKLKDIYPKSFPFTAKYKENIIDHLATSWGITGFTPYYNEEEKIWKYSVNDPQMKHLLDYLRKLHSEKLLDPEFLTLTEAAWSSRMTQKDTSFVTFDWIGKLDIFSEQAKTSIPGYDLRYGNPIGPKGTIKTLSKVFNETAVSKNSRSELAFRFLDFLLSPAGAALSTMGVEGETYTIDENGIVKYPDFPEDKKVSITDLDEKYGLFQISKRYDRRSCYFNFTEREQEAQDKGVNENRMEPEDPILAFTEQERSAIMEKESKIISSAKETFVKYIMSADSGDAVWNKWVQESKQLGADDIIKIYNDAQKRYDAQ